MAYLYEMHLHTEQGSACGKAPGRDYIKKYKELGFDGIFVTDHFFRGNARPDRSLPWETWVNEFCKGYEDAKEEGDKQGLQVFFGLEERFDWDEWLVYGIDKQFLLDHPDMKDWSRGQWLENVHKAGGCIIQAHPFRARGYMNSIDPCLGVDGYEIANAGNDAVMDSRAAAFAGKLGKFTSCGSDIHWPDHRLGEDVFAMSFDERLTSAKNYVKNVLENKAHGMVIPKDRIQPLSGTPELPLKLTVYDENGQKTNLTATDIF